MRDTRVSTALVPSGAEGRQVAASLHVEPNLGVGGLDVSLASLLCERAIRESIGEQLSLSWT